MMARVATAAHDPIAGNFVGAYGLIPASGPGSDLSAVQSPTLPSVIQFVTPRRIRSAGVPRADSQDPANSPQSSIGDSLPHGSRGPQGGAQSSGGGGGAASTLMLMVAFALLAAPCLKFVPRPTAHLVCAEAHRLERPG
jgi:hypothetical protein